MKTVKALRQLFARPLLTHSLVTAAALFVGSFTPLALHAQPQITAQQLANLQQVAPSQIPRYATFWEWYYGRNGQAFAAPLPMNPYGPEVPVYYLQDGEYLIDNGPDDLPLAEQQPQLQAEGLLQPMDASGTTAQPNDATQLDAGYAPGTFYICSVGVTNQVITLVLTNTVQGTLYEIQCGDSLTNTADWVSEGAFPGLDGSTPFTFSMGNRTNQLWLRAKSWIDSSGSGIPDWWWNDYGLNGLDPYALCPSGDGWTILQAYQNGWNPWDWHTPPAPTGLSVNYYGASSNVIVQWNPSPGPATNYILRRYIAWGETNYFSITGQTTFTDTPPSGGPDPKSPPAYQVMAQYPGGPSAWSAPVSLFNPAISLCVPPADISDDGLHFDYAYGRWENWDTGVNASVVRGPQGHLYLVTGNLPPRVAAVRVSAFPNPDSTPSYPVGFEANYMWENPQPFTSSPSSDYFEVSAAALQSGFCELPTWLTPPYGCYSIKVEAVANDGTLSECAPFAGFPQDIWSLLYPTGNGAVPFLDGRRQIKENAEFQLRAAQGTVPFAIWQHNDNLTNYSTTQYFEAAALDYVVAGFHFLYTSPTFRSQTNLQGSGLVLDEFRPFEQNYLYANFLLNGPPWSDGGYLNTNWDGTGTPFWSYSAAVNQPWSQFHAGAFAQSGATNTIPDLLPQSATDWLYLAAIDSFAYLDLTTSQWLIQDSANLYGLKLQSVQAWSFDEATFGSLTTFYPGQGVPWDHYWPVFFNVERPQFQIADYYFARAPRAFQLTGERPRATVPEALDPRPGEPDFTTSAQTPLLIAPIGKPMVLNAWAKERLVNGFQDKFAYLEQYFENPLTIGADGTPTTNSAGLLSPYGEFFPMMPGPVALVTMPDVDTGQRGTGVVNVIKLQLDVNHNGQMDLSFGGQDNTSQARPARMWVNNDHDEPASGNEPDRDLNDWGNPPPVPLDYSYGQIRCQRNLEDFARLWICGMPALPTNQGYSVQLAWSQISSGAPRMRLYWASEGNGGIGYLTNTAIAAQQIAEHNTPIGEISPTSTLTLPANAFSNGLTKYFLYEAGGVGSGQLTLTISQGGTNTIAQTSAWFDFHDITDFYEMGLVTNVLQDWPDMVQTNLTSGFQVLSCAKVNPGDAKQLAVFIHGWRMEGWDWFSFSSTMFKRFWWQGYQGRFAALRWPTRNANTELFPQMGYITYNRSERIAFKSGTGAAAYLNDLRSRFPDYTISGCSHSMGGIVAMQTLKQLAAAGQQPVDNWVLMQAAVPAQCFDTNAPNFQMFLNGEAVVPTPDVYRNYAAGITNALRPGGKIANFFNPDDFALWNWQLNQAFYVANLLGNGVTTMKPNAFFGYSTDGVNSLLSTNAWNQSFYSVIYGGYYGNGPTRAITDPLELMPFVARPRGLAVGASPNVHGQIQGQQLDLENQLGFGAESSDHSGQFNRNIQEAPIWPFYSQLKTNLFPEP